MMDVARRMATAERPPARSVLFLAVGAEEKGLLGSEYFARAPTLGDRRIVANVNMDGAFPFYDFSDVIAFGAVQSDMGEMLADAIRPLGMTVAPDPFPEQGIFTRSDQYSFVKRGVPALFLYNGFTDTDGRNVGRAVWDTFLAKHYHQPSDDLDLPIRYDVAARLADVFRRTVRTVADAPEAPRWYEDSLFGQRFVPDAPKAARTEPTDPS
ncbi:MAG: M28 family peptidase, partial [Pseudomonadota bacterium]